MSILRLSLLASMSRSAEKEGGIEAHASSSSCAESFKDLLAAAAGACIESASETAQESILKPFRKGSGAERVEVLFQRVKSPHTVGLFCPIVGLF